MHIRPEVLPFIVGSLVAGVLLAVSLKRLFRSRRVAVKLGSAIAVILCAYFLYFFRDPDRLPPEDASAIVAGADGTVVAITELREDNYLKTNCVRISIFLSLFDVHVNRAPIAGQSVFLGYFPGKHFFTFQEKSSEVNQHNKIIIAWVGLPILTLAMWRSGTRRPGVIALRRKSKLASPLKHML